MTQVGATIILRVHLDLPELVVRSLVEREGDHKALLDLALGPAQNGADQGAEVEIVVEDLSSAIATKGAVPPAPFGPLGYPNGERWLTPRECQVLGLVALGSSNQEISQRLSLSQNTVKAHVHHIMQKMSCANRIQVALAGRGMLQPKAPIQGHLLR